MNTRRLRVGLTQRVDEIAGRDERRDAVDQQWAALLDGAGFVPVGIPNLLADPGCFVEELELAAIVLSGGNDLGTAPERDRTERALLAIASRNDIPVLAVCRGLQLLVDDCGGLLHRVEGHVARQHPIKTVGQSAWPLRDGRVVNSFHTWAATPDALGPELVPLAVAPDGTVEAAARRGTRQVGVMWHPERDPRDLDDLELLRALMGVS